MWDDSETLLCFVFLKEKKILTNGLKKAFINFYDLN